MTDKKKDRRIESESRCKKKYDEGSDRCKQTETTDSEQNDRFLRPGQQYAKPHASEIWQH